MEGTEAENNEVESTEVENTKDNADSTHACVEQGYGRSTTVPCL